MPISAPDGPPRLVVFDCDGTLVDSQHAIVACMRDAFSVHGCAAPEDAAIRQVIGLSLDEAVARLAAGAPAEKVVEAYRQAFFAMRSRPDFHEPLFPGVAAALEALGSEGCLLGVATGKARRGLLATLERHGLSGRFVTLQTADLNPGKPHPAMLLKAMAETGADPDRTVLVGDTSYDMEMARRAGARAVGVAWGYHDRRELEAAGADRIVERCEELADCVLSLL
ncbi:MAG: haloacid dehalogenase [Rhodospirillales bacterium]|jgi:phosphoglycolate phosphatase|nr:haloacid dehalogenase [Rhodospirillales bacterium]